VGTGSILVVDDDPKFLRFSTEILIGAGYDVHAASDPAQVKTMVASLAPDLIILDISMPGKDGFEVARELRASENTKHVPCMFITAHRDSTHVRNAKDAGGVAYLEKPVRSSSLIWMVKSLLSKQQRPRPDGALGGPA
jgi:CheY-like chemotaxis protein